MKKLLIIFMLLFPLYAWGGGLTVDYYETYGEITKQIWPDKDWDLVVRDNTTPPLESKLLVVWVNYTENVVALSYSDSREDKTGSCTRCVAIYVDDAQLAPTPEYINMMITYFEPITCKDFKTVLEAAAGKKI